VCSSDVEELVQVSTRVLVLRRGHVGAELTGSDLTVERIEEEQLRPTEAQPASQGQSTSEAADEALQKGETSNA
jgi:ribose transport system ATP-binding protein